MNFVVLIVLIALAAGVGVGFMVNLDPGYVRVSWLNYLIETNIWIALFLMVGFYFALHYSLRALSRAFHLRAGYSSWKAGINERRAKRYTERGMAEYAEGNWKKAQRHLTTAAAKSETPLIHYLTAAQAANQNGRYKDSDRLLKEAIENAPNAEIGIGLTRAQLLQSRGEPDQALATLLNLRRHSTRNPAVLKALASVYHQLGDWQALVELIPDLEQTKAMDNDALDELRRQAWIERLRTCTQQSIEEKHADNPTGRLNDLWDALPASLRKDGPIIGAYAQGLNALGASGHAFKIISKTLKTDWDEGLVKQLGLLPAEDPATALESTEGWMRDHPQDAVLFLTLGRMAMRANQWDKAQEYLQTSEKLSGSPEATAEIGRLLVLQGQNEQANNYLQRSLEKSLNLPPLAQY